MRGLRGLEVSRRNIWLPGTEPASESQESDPASTRGDPRPPLDGWPQLMLVVHSEHKRIRETLVGFLENLGSRLGRGYDWSQRFGHDV